MVDSFYLVQCRALCLLLVLSLDGERGVVGTFLVPRWLGRCRHPAPTQSPSESTAHGLRTKPRESGNVFASGGLVASRQRQDGCTPPLQVLKSGNDDIAAPTDPPQANEPPRTSLRRRDSVKACAVGQLAAYVLASMCLASAVVGWESVIGEHSLPSRQTRSRIVALRDDDPFQFSGQLGSKIIRNLVVRGERTVRGMGFGLDERRLLYSQDFDPGSAVVERTDDFAVTERERNNQLLLLPDRPSYNEVMEQHRKDTVYLWKQLYRDRMTVSAQERRGAIHDVLLALESLDELKRLATDYRWDDLRDTVRSSMWQSDLNHAAALIGQIKHENTIAQSTVQGKDDEFTARFPLSPTVGFDWGSCAWRHACGAWADWQESIDQIDALLGVLEPQEVLFCLDIVERSVREVLAAIPPTLWDPRDWTAFEAFPKYEPYVFSDETHGSFTEEMAGGETDDLDPYIRALMDLRIE
jgi:hypothetical protein